MEKRLQELDRIIEAALDCENGECTSVIDFGAGLYDYMFDLSTGLASSAALSASSVEKRVMDSLNVMLFDFFKVRLLGIEYNECDGESDKNSVERIMKIVFEAESREGRNYKLGYERRLF